jgi:hypothetical protein
VGSLAVMRRLDGQQQRMLERPKEAGDQPVALGDLRGRGVDFPAVVLSELELNGHAIEHVYQDRLLIGVRLRDPERADSERRRATSDRCRQGL